MIELKHSKPNKGFIVEEINDKLKKAGEVKPFEHPHVENDPKSASDHIDAVKKHVEKELKATDKTAVSTKGEDRVVFAESMMFRNKGELAEFLTKLREQSIRRRVIPLHENKDGYRFEVRFERKPVLESANGKPILVDKDGKEVKVGDHVVSFRGEGATVTGMNPPTVPYKSGKVIVKWDNSESEMEYYVGVFNLGWKGFPWQDANESKKEPNECLKEAKGDIVHLDLTWEQFLMLKSAVAGAIKEALAKEDDSRLDKLADLERAIDAQEGSGKGKKPTTEDVHGKDNDEWWISFGLHDKENDVSADTEIGSGYINFDSKEKAMDFFKRAVAKDYLNAENVDVNVSGKTMDDVVYIDAQLMNGDNRYEGEGIDSKEFPVKKTATEARRRPQARNCKDDVCECDKPKDEKHEDAPEWDFDEEDRLASESFAKEALEDDAVDTEPIKINESIEVPEKDMWDFGDEE